MCDVLKTSSPLEGEDKGGGFLKKQNNFDCQSTPPRNSIAVSTLPQGEGYKATLTPLYWEKAKRELSKNDPIISEVILKYKGEALTGKNDAYFTLARSIIGQQISVKAADSVWRKLEDLVSEISISSILNANPNDLKNVGISSSKINYLVHIAESINSGSLDINNLYKLPDDNVRKELTKIKGIGPWTAEMFMIFHMQRPDILPIKDIGLIRGIEKLYGKNKSIERVTNNWKPWRTVATWYIWRSLDPVPVIY